MVVVLFPSRQRWRHYPEPRNMKLSESLAQLIAELEESDRRFRQEVEGLIKTADRIIETVDRMIKED